MKQLTEEARIVRLLRTSPIEDALVLLGVIRRAQASRDEGQVAKRGPGRPRKVKAGTESDVNQ